MTRLSTGDASLLPDELLWADGGHASDVVLTALSDGEASIVPDAVRLHVERCTACTTHLGHAALLSLHVARELKARAEHEHAAAMATASIRPLPRSAIALGLLVALLGLVPSVFDAAFEPSAIRQFATRDVPLSLRGLSTLAHHLDKPGSPLGLFLTYGAATLLVCMGFAVVRLLPKKETSR